MPNSAELLSEGLRAERAGALERALEAYRAVADSTSDPDARAEALTREASVHRTRCNWDDALKSARDAQEIARTADLPQRLAEAVVAEANVLICQGKFDTAIPKLELLAQNEDPRVRGIALQ